MKTLNYSVGIELAEYLILIVAAGFVLPLILIPAVHLTGYSEILEELCKALVILFLVLKLSKLKWQVIGASVFGFLFGLSESIFYLNNIFQIGNLDIFWQRFLFTIPLHIITVLIILFFARKNRKFIILGTIVAIVVHLLFNQIIINIFSLGL